MWLLLRSLLAATCIGVVLSCRDLENCTAWVQAGLCTSPKDFEIMKDICARSCNLCSRSSACRDETEYAMVCIELKQLGFCQKGQSWIEQNCAATCGYCQSSTVASKETTRVCADSLPYRNHCPEYNKAGFCASSSPHQNFMVENCAATCGFCTRDGALPSPTPEAVPSGTPQVCTDSSPYKAYCAEYRKSGYCAESSSHQDFMRLNCAATCGFCTDSIIIVASTTESAAPFKTHQVCSDSSLYATYCPDYAKAGHCFETSPHKNFMAENCAASCSFCIAEEVSVTVASEVVTTTDEDTPLPSECYDESPWLCPEWAENNFCTDPEYRDDARRECRMSCGLCTRDISWTPSPLKVTKPSRLAEQDSICTRTTAASPSAADQLAPDLLLSLQAGIYHGDLLVCDAALITPDWVIAAAHCVWEHRETLSALHVRLGRSNRDTQSRLGESFNITRLVVHPSWSSTLPFYLMDNIAILNLHHAANISQDADLACVGKAQYTVPDELTCYLTSLQRTSADSLSIQEARLSRKSGKDCPKAYVHAVSSLWTVLPNGVVCPGYMPSGINRGFLDSGDGLLFCRSQASPAYELHGVVSSRYRDQSSDVYTIVTRLATYRPWIDQQII